MKTTFVRKVSKGSRFNQVYIPKEMEKKIEVGDLVEVKLLKKHVELCYKNVKKLSEFKEYLVKEIFSYFRRFNGIETVFVVGSFLFETVDYNDIDIVIITDGMDKELQKEFEAGLREKFSQRFHVLLFDEEKLRLMMERDPLTRAMLDSYISNKKT